MTQPTPIQLKRKHAGRLIDIKVNFFEVARAYEVAPRVLLAWIRHENDKWENDPYLGREPGPDEHYSGEWPNEVDEVEAYRLMGLKPEEFDDPALEKRYRKYLTRIAAKSAAFRKRQIKS